MRWRRRPASRSSLALSGDDREHELGRATPIEIGGELGAQIAPRACESLAHCIHVVLCGGDDEAQARRIGVGRHFDQGGARESRIARVLESGHLAVATSGSYERGARVVDPQTGLAPTGVLSVTVAGPELGVADAYATAAYARGPQAPQWTRELPARGYEALTIMADKRVLVTPGFPAG